MIRSLFMAGLLLMASCFSLAHEYEAGGLLIHHPWARATAPDVRNGAVFLSIKNAGDADQLVAAKSDVAAEVSLHQMKLDNGVMRMGMVSAVDIPAKGEQQLKPGGYHIMLMGLKAPLKEGDRFPLTLLFKRVGEVKVSVKIEALGAQSEEMKH